MSSQALTTRCGASRPRRQDGAVRRVGDAVVLSAGHAARAPALPRSRGRVRREPPRHRARDRPGRSRTTAACLHQRSRADLARSRAVHAPARPARRLGRRRHHRVVGRRRALRRDAQRVQHGLRRRRAARRRRRRRARRHERARCARGAGSDRTRGARHRVAGGRRDRALPSSCRRMAKRTPASSPAPDTPARTASSSPFPRPSPPTCGRRWSARASSLPVWARATRCGSRPACRCTATSSAPASRRCRLGSAGSSTGTRVRSSAARRSSVNGRPESRGASAGLSVPGRRPLREGQVVDACRCGGRHGDERQLLADARARDRARAGGRLGRGGRRARRSTSAAATSRPRWSRRRSCGARRNARHTRTGEGDEPSRCSMPRCRGFPREGHGRRQT